MDETSAEAFMRRRPRLVRLAYRMLGSVAEAEDAVQDAYLRWHGVSGAEIRDPEAYLVRIVTRLCLDRLGSAQRQRTTYVGPWLPEPVMVEAEEDPDEERVSFALMMALERLSPLERAAFLLHDVFGLGFEAIGEALARAAPACRQLAARARRRLDDVDPRFAVGAEEGRRLAAAFFAASRQGDTERLRDLLAADAVAMTDGGGLRSSALKPILGRDRVAAFFAGLARKAGGLAPPLVREGWIDGLPAYATREHDGLVQTTALAVEAGLIRAVYIVRNPEKLRHLDGPRPAAVIP